MAAARRLFTEGGYAGATIEALAAEAGVAVETVYAAFGNKKAILTRLVEVAVGGDEAPIPLLERPGPQAVLQGRDQRQQVRQFAHDIREIMTRMAPIFEVLHTSAKTEPEIAELLQRLLRERLRGMEAFVGALAANGPLRPVAGGGQAAEAVWALTSAEVFCALTGSLGWSGERYESWLADTLERLLLP
ncbi:MAG: helix-turn-helix transcriptional regulator [Anaerolineales bacterium]|nr:helix-turn-helix transcriptional regulator [Anaerolineales bacterium]